MYHSPDYFVNERSRLKDQQPQQSHQQTSDSNSKITVENYGRDLISKIEASLGPLLDSYDTKVEVVMKVELNEDGFPAPKIKKRDLQQLTQNNLSHLKESTTVPKQEGPFVIVNDSTCKMIERISQLSAKKGLDTYTLKKLQRHVPTIEKSTAKNTKEKHDKQQPGKSETIKVAKPKSIAPDSRLLAGTKASQARHAPSDTSNPKPSQNISASSQNLGSTNSVHDRLYQHAVEKRIALEDQIQKQQLPLYKSEAEVKRDSIKRFEHDARTIKTLHGTAAEKKEQLEASAVNDKVQKSMTENSSRYRSGRSESPDSLQNMGDSRQASPSSFTRSVRPPTIAHSTDKRSNASAYRKSNYSSSKGSKKGELNAEPVQPVIPQPVLKKSLSSVVEEKFSPVFRFRPVVEHPHSGNFLSEPEFKGFHRRKFQNYLSRAYRVLYQDAR